MHKRVRAVIIKDNKILLMRRVKNGRKYFVFPGGGVKKKENFEAAIRREIKEEFDIDITIETFLFRIENKGRVELYFLIKNFTGQPKLSGEERQMVDDNNQYFLEWKNLSGLKKLSNLFPQEAKNRIEAEFKKATILMV
ncbi:NUDIX domain-containing protein [Patescibacteria group bacterium]|nr:NUDIX domain-containing protein [Patescibacteria group bacterium]